MVHEFLLPNGRTNVSRPQQPDPAQTYEDYLGKAIADPWTRVLLGYAGPQPGERALDLACGTGSVARQLAPILGPEGKVVALDINAQMLAVGRALEAPLGAPIEWLEGDAVAPPLPDSAFDLVVCQQGLQFFSDRERALGEMRRMLAPGARAVVSVWQSLDRHPLYEALFRATTRYLNASIDDVALSFSLGSRDALHDLLVEAGLRAVQVMPRTLEVRLPSPERFVQLTVLGAATSVPAFTRLDDGERGALVGAIVDETRSAIDTYRKADALVFPMSSNIAVGRT